MLQPIEHNTVTTELVYVLTRTGWQARRHGGTLRILGSLTFDAFENIDGLVLSKEVLTQDLWRALFSGFLRREAGVSITKRPTKRLSVGHRREKLFDGYFSSTIASF